MAMLTHAQVSPAQKSQLMEWIQDPGSWPIPKSPKDSDLCEMASPLTFSLDNPEIKHLESAALQVATHWLPPRYDAGQALLNEIERRICSTAVGLPEPCEPLFRCQGTVVSGRTLKIDQGDQALYYKFQRKEESLTTLMQEGVVHTVREHRPDLLGSLRSKLPGDARFFRLYLDQLPKTLPQFNDRPEISTDESGRE